MKREHLGLNHGGLMRCCVASFLEWVGDDPRADTQPLQELRCRYEDKTTMRVSERGDTVEWIGRDQLIPRP